MIFVLWNKLVLVPENFQNSLIITFTSYCSLRGLLLVLDADGVARLGEEVAGGEHRVRALVVGGYHELALPAETLNLEFSRRPCTSCSALQAK